MAEHGILHSTLLALKNFIMVDPKARYDLASLWMYQEFVTEETRKEAEEEEDQFEQEMVMKGSYNESVRLLLYGLKERLDPKDK